MEKVRRAVVVSRPATKRLTSCGSVRENEDNTSFYIHLVLKDSLVCDSIGV